MQDGTSSRLSGGAACIGAMFDPLSEEYLADPYPFMSEARNAAPVFYSEKLDHWVVTRYSLIRQVFLNPQVFSAANANAPLAPTCPAAAKARQCIKRDKHDVSEWPPATPIDHAAHESCSQATSMRPPTKITPPQE